MSISEQDKNIMNNKLRNVRINLDTCPDLFYKIKDFIIKILLHKKNNLQSYS